MKANYKLLGNIFTARNLYYWKCKHWKSSLFNIWTKKLSCNQLIKYNIYNRIYKTNKKDMWHGNNIIIKYNHRSILFRSRDTQTSLVCCLMCCDFLWCCPCA